jgi:hypothetical protein
MKRRKMTMAERKAAQRERDRLAGWIEVKVKIAADQKEVLRDFARSLPPPPKPTDPEQLSLIQDLEDQLSKGKSRGG